MDGYTGYGDDILDLRINSSFVNWGTYNVPHSYAASFTGTGATVNFNIFDGDTVTDIQNPSWFSDNSGTSASISTRAMPASRVKKTAALHSTTFQSANTPSTRSIKRGG